MTSIKKSDFFKSISTITKKKFSKNKKKIVILNAN